MPPMPHPSQGAPVPKKQNLAARAGRWSGQHRKRAVSGWLAFVTIAPLIGAKIGTNTTPSDEDGVVGDSARSAQIVKDTFPNTPGDQVLIQSKAAGPREPAYRA